MTKQILDGAAEEDGGSGGGGGTQNENLIQINGTTVLAGAGATGAGSQRVTVAQDTTTIAGSAPGTAGTPSANVVSVQGEVGMTKLLVTPDALPANQSVNVNQVGGAAITEGQKTMANSVPVAIASDQSAVPISAASLPLPTGAATAANQTGVQGTVGAGTAPANMNVGGGVYNSTLPSPTTGQSVATQVDAKGNARFVNMDAAGNARGQNVDAQNGALIAGEGTAGTPTGGILTVQGVASMTKLLVTPDALPANQSVNVAQFGGSNTVTGTGASGAGIPRVTVSNDSIINQGAVTPVLVNALSTTVKSVVSSQAATLEDYYVWNPNSTVAYIQIFDVATSGGVTLGTTTPKWSIGIPPTSAANISRLGLSFTNGIQVAATTTATGSTALSSAVDGNFGYR